MTENTETPVPQLPQNPMGYTRVQALWRSNMLGYLRSTPAFLEAIRQGQITEDLLLSWGIRVKIKENTVEWYFAEDDIFPEDKRIAVVVLGFSKTEGENTASEDQNPTQ